MKAVKLFAASASLLVFCTLSSRVEARFAHPTLELVPISRLLNNLQAIEKSSEPGDIKKRAHLEFQIGRLESMAYAKNTESAEVVKGSSSNQIEEPRIFYGWNNARQFDMNKTDKSGTPTKSGREHLERAISHLRESVKLDPSVNEARMGLAWCLDQSGKKSEALKLYLQVFEIAYKAESKSSGMYGFSLTEECSGYILPLLDPVKDEAQIAEIKSKTSTVAKNFQAVTPIIVPLTDASNIDSLIEKSEVTFNLNGQSPKICASWPTKQAGFLVFDEQGKGDIDSGTQLIGEVSFWIFWKNGYEVLTALDDNHDGRLTGDELLHIAIWCDTNGDGKAQRTEVNSLAAWNISELSCTYEEESVGLLKSRAGVVFGNGEKRPTYDVWIEQSPIH